MSKIPIVIDFTSEYRYKYTPFTKYAVCSRGLLAHGYHGVGLRIISKISSGEAID